jgi:OPT oligopeptide transporter protein
LPWETMSLGMGLSGAAWLLGLSPLAFAIGLYLPVTTTAPLLLGGLVRWWLDRRDADRTATLEFEAPESPADPQAGATLVASGMIAGEALAGIAAAATVVLAGEGAMRLRPAGSLGAWEPLLTVAAWLVLVAALARGDGRRDGGQ